MKRERELDDETDEEREEPPTFKHCPDTDEAHILINLQKNLKSDNDMNDFINQRLFETQKQYYTVYMKKLMKQIPLGQQLVEIVTQLGELSKDNGFEYMFTAAKSAIQSSIRVKQIKVFQAIFDMIYGVGWRYLHEKVVTPALKNVVKPEQLDRAFSTYQRSLVSNDDSKELELQTLLYYIQEDIDKRETSKVSNPFYSRITQQAQGVSDYVISLLTAATQPYVDAMAPVAAQTFGETSVPVTTQPYFEGLVPAAAQTFGETFVPGATQSYVEPTVSAATQPDVKETGISVWIPSKESDVEED